MFCNKHTKKDCDKLADSADWSSNAAELTKPVIMLLKRFPIHAPCEVENQKAKYFAFGRMSGTAKSILIVGK
jgi:hypothetical protein